MVAAVEGQGLDADAALGQDQPSSVSDELEPELHQHAVETDLCTDVAALVGCERRGQRPRDGGQVAHAGEAAQPQSFTKNSLSSAGPLSELVSMVIANPRSGTIRKPEW